MLKLLFCALLMLSMAPMANAMSGDETNNNNTNTEEVTNENETSTENHKESDKSQIPNVCGLDCPEDDCWPW